MYNKGLETVCRSIWRQFDASQETFVDVTETRRRKFFTRQVLAGNKCVQACTLDEKLELDLI